MLNNIFTDAFHYLQDKLEKAFGVKDISKLTKKEVYDKNGTKRIVYVNDGPEQIVSPEPHKQEEQSVPKKINTSKTEPIKKVKKIKSQSHKNAEKALREVRFYHNIDLSNEDSISKLEDNLQVLVKSSKMLNLPKEYRRKCINKLQSLDSFLRRNGLAFDKSSYSIKSAKEVRKTRTAETITKSKVNKLLSSNLDSAIAKGREGLDGLNSKLNSIYSSMKHPNISSELKKDCKSTINKVRGFLQSRGMDWIPAGGGTIIRTAPSSTTKARQIINSLNKISNHPDFSTEQGKTWLKNSLTQLQGLSDEDKQQLGETNVQNAVGYLESLSRLHVGDGK